jgi:hypothetical protein
MAVRAAMGLSGPWWMLCEDLLTRIRRVAFSSAIGIASNITVGVTDVVSVLLVELVVCDLLESTPPEDQAIFEGQANALQEQGVLQSTEVLQVRVRTQLRMQVFHAEREML